MGSTPGLIVEFEAAIRIVLDYATAAVQRHEQPIERVSLLESRGRVLAEDIVADRDQPGFDRSTRDGFAVRTTNWLPGACLTVVGQVRAGEVWTGSALADGDAIQIMTGAPLPGGADAVVMVEHAIQQAGQISPAGTREITYGENIVPRGAEAHLGEVVLPVGTLLGAAGIALAATCGYPTLSVRARPRVAVVSTGDELVEIDQQPAEQQIRNSNSYAIAAMVVAAGGVPEILPVARDRREEISERIARGRLAGMLVLSGGVSMGEYDLVEEVLTEFGAEFFFTGVKMQPGKPVVFGRLPPRNHAPECFFFGLPGNPVSTQVTFHCFAELFLRLLAGETVAGPRWAQATLGEKVSGKPGITRLLPARMDGVTVKLTGWQGSGDLAANARANCYAELLPGRSYAADALIRVLLR